uniref:Cytochrome b561 domain-containing protein n=1 Tax=Mycena chlorophos TaxID=658473 RepID=A0ABQ0LQ82_MYCCL|nr:predicted protein [Mycena chlorophos]
MPELQLHENSARGNGIPLFPTEIKARNHAILCTTGFLILLPIGVLVARYTRTWNRFWFWNHATIQLIISGPVIFAGWSQGYQVARELELQSLFDPHQKIGITLLALYVAQLVFGLLAHFVKLPRRVFPGGLRRAPHNYFHVLLGLAMLALAGYQVHYGLYTEWTFATGGIHPVPESAKHAWMALLIVFWVLYVAGLAFLPIQFRQEKASAMPKSEKQASAADSDTARESPVPVAAA